MFFFPGGLTGFYVCVGGGGGHYVELDPGEVRKGGGVEGLSREVGRRRDGKLERGARRPLASQRSGLRRRFDLLSL